LRLLLSTLEGLGQFFLTLPADGPKYAVALKALLTLVLERFFALIRAANRTPTMLEYCVSKMPATLEVLKQMTSCPFNYPTNRSFYPSPDRALSFSSLKFQARVPLKKQLRETRTVEEKAALAEYCAAHFKPVPQNAVRSFAKFKPGTMPLNTFSVRMPAENSPLDLNDRLLLVNPEAARPPAGDRIGDGSAVFLAVTGARRPEQLQEDAMFVVEVATQFYDDKRYDPLSGKWHVAAEDPLLFCYMASADVHRADILGEISCVPYVDSEGRACIAVNEDTLHDVLQCVRRGADDDSQPYEDTTGQEIDASVFFGRSQSTHTSQAAARAERDERATRRRQRDE
jgi:hypothetical protein